MTAPLRARPLWVVGILMSSSAVVAQLSPGFSCDMVNVAPACDADCQYCQMLALIDDFWSLNGPEWHNNTGWPLDGNTDDYVPLAHCGWHGVYCCGAGGSLIADRDSSGRNFVVTGQTACNVPFGVAAILLASNNLNGTLDSQLLTSSPLRISLDILTLNNNSLSGDLQESSAGAPFLHYLNLDGNRFSGSVPPDLFLSPSLNYVSIAGNCLSGPIPDLANVTSLTYLDLSHNRLSSRLPATWLDSRRLRYFSAAFNHLTGPIPAPSVESARIAAGWPTAWSVLEIRLQSNQLTGSIPSALGFLQIQVLDLATNDLTGKIDELLMRLSILKEFRVNNNQLTGSLPANFASTHIETLSVKYNKLTGKLPESLGKLTDLTEIMIQNNSFHGSFPESMRYMVGLELLTAYTSGLAYEYDSNSTIATPLLPKWLYTDLTPSLYTSFSSYQYLICQPVRVNRTILPNLASIQIDPSYYHFKGCSCTVGYKLVDMNLGMANQSMGCQPTVASNEAHRTVVVVSATTVSGVAILLLLLVGLLWLLRLHIAAFTLQRAKKRGPPEQGRSITLVSTDIEGSTELWEWDRDAMDAATKLHDRVMRHSLTAFHGYEVNTEGDSFLIAFHEPGDAIAWAVTVQQELLVTSWPWQLEQHERTCTRWTRNGVSQPDAENACALSTATSNASAVLGGKGVDAIGRLSIDVGFAAATHLSAAEADAPEERQSEVAFRGLAVRMVIVTGRAEKVTFHRISRRMEYEGQTVKLLKAIDSVPNGGQIVIDAQTFSAVSSIISDVTKLLHQRPDFEALARGSAIRSRENAFASDLTVLEPIESGTAQLQPADFQSLGGPQLMTRPSLRKSVDNVYSRQSSLNFGSKGAHNAKQAAAKKDGFLGRAMSLFKSGRGRRPLEAGLQQTMSSRRRTLLKIDSANSSEALAADFGQEQRLLRRSWPSLRFFKSRRPQTRHNKSVTSAGPSSNGQAALIMMDMGQHVIKDWPEPQQLHQVLVPSVEDRAHFLPPLSTFEQLTPGYFEAPAAREAPLGGRLSSCPARLLPNVTLVFCALDGLADIKENASSGTAIAMYLSCVRRLLKKTRGYECQEADCTFMLAFSQPVEAVQFCLLVQEEMMAEVWGEDILRIDCCRVRYGERKQRLFHGPRVRMGIYEGLPTRVCPHTVTGRADYFGPVVNRAARFCLSAAHGGQIVAPLKTVMKVISEWTQQPCPPMLEHGRPIVTMRGEALELLGLQDSGTAPQNPQPSPTPIAEPLSCLTEDSQRLKSMRVMDWIKSDGEQPARTSGGSSLPRVHTAPSLGGLAQGSSKVSEQTGRSSLEEARHDISNGTACGQGTAGGGAAKSKNTSPGHAAGSGLASNQPSSSLPMKSSAQGSQLVPVSPFAGGGTANSEQPQARPRSFESVRYNGSQGEKLGDTASLGTSIRKSEEFVRQPDGSLLVQRKRSVARPSVSEALKRGLRPSMHSLGSGYTSALHSDAWQAVQEVEAHHIGDMKFKGVSGVHTVMQLNNARFGGRKFPTTPPTSKAELVSPGRGLAYSVIIN